MRRSLSREEAALWARLAGTVPPLNRPRNGAGHQPRAGGRSQAALTGFCRSRCLVFPPAPPLRGVPPPRSGEDRKLNHTLDASWDRKRAHWLVHPDFTLDLHGHSLDAAHARLDHGLTLALSQGARLVLVITGRARPAEGHAGRGERRGAIRAKFLDWLANGAHASRIAAIRPAHPRHGGAGAVYVVLKRSR